ncbi:MAG: O-antigen ligase family protein, partial [Planctomycetota bacterium]
MFIAYSLLFVTVAQRIRSYDDVERLVKCVGLSAGAMALFGFLQWGFGNSRFLWIYEHPSRDPAGQLCGAFANRNHFAHFLVLGVPPLALWLTWFCSDSSQPDRRATATAIEANWRFAQRREMPIALLLAACIAGVFLSGSRGGALALAAALCVSLFAFWQSQLLRGRTLAILSAVSVATFAIVSVTNYHLVSQRLATLTSASLEEIDASAGRRKIWTANVAAIREGGWIGAGAGSHREIYPVYLSEPTGKEFTHAESGPLQILTELGPVGGALLVLAIGLCAHWVFSAFRTAPSTRARVLVGVCAGGLSASVAHSLCDLVWYIP